MAKRAHPRSHFSSEKQIGESGLVVIARKGSRPYIDEQNCQAGPLILFAAERGF